MILIRIESKESLSKIIHRLVKSRTGEKKEVEFCANLNILSKHILILLYPSKKLYRNLFFRGLWIEYDEISS